MSHNHIRHFFFDLDNTLTKSRAHITPHHSSLFEELCKAYDVIVVTGGTVEHIHEQLLPTHSYHMLAQSGNHAVHKDKTELWFEPLSETQKKIINESIVEIRSWFNESVSDENDLVEDRGAQVGYSVIGYHESPEKKYAFDPDFSRRKRALAELSHLHEKLKAHDVEVMPAGSSGYNFTPIGKDKGVNVTRLIQALGWHKEDSLYVGDALGPGENDASVIGIIETKAVRHPDDTFEFLKEVLS